MELSTNKAIAGTCGGGCGCSGGSAPAGGAASMSKAMGAGAGCGCAHTFANPPTAITPSNTAFFNPPTAITPGYTTFFNPPTAINAWSAAALSPIAVAPADPLAYVAAVNNMVRLGAPALAGSQPGWLHLWDASSGNLLRQYSVPFVDALAPQPIFTFNSLASLGGISGTVFNNGWFMTFFDSLSASGTSAVVTKGNGATFAYTNKTMAGIYTAPLGAVNQLQGLPKKRNEEMLTPKRRRSRWLEIWRQLQDVAEGKVVAGDPASTEARLLEELDGVEWEASREDFKNRGRP